MEIPSLRTFYAGTLFRSRLEARWAVFLTELGYHWSYEPITWELAEYDPYVCDFWIYEWEAWLEVKPTEPEEIAFRRAQALAWESGQPVILAAGPPWRFLAWAMHLATSDPMAVEVFEQFAVCPRCPALALLSWAPGGLYPLVPHRCPRQAWETRRQSARLRRALLASAAFRPEEVE